MFGREAGGCRRLWNWMLHHWSFQSWYHLGCRTKPYSTNLKRCTLVATSETPKFKLAKTRFKGSKWELKSGYGMSYCMERSRAKPLGPFQNQRPSGRPMKLSKTTSSQMRTSACGQQDNGLTSGAQHTVLRGRNAVRLSWCLAR